MSEPYLDQIIRCTAALRCWTRSNQGASDAVTYLQRAVGLQQISASAAAAAFATNVQVKVPHALLRGMPLADAQRQLFCALQSLGSTQEPPHYWVLAAGGASIEEREPGLGFFFFLGWELVT